MCACESSGWGGKWEGGGGCGGGVGERKTERGCGGGAGGVCAGEARREREREARGVRERLYKVSLIEVYSHYSPPTKFVMPIYRSYLQSRNYCKLQQQSAISQSQYNR